MTPRPGSQTARLARVGFTEPARAADLLAQPPLAELSDDDRLLTALAATADPDAAIANLMRLLESGPGSEGLAAALRTDEALQEGLLDVLGASAALADHLVRHPEHWQLLRGKDDDGADRAPARPSALGLRAEMLTAVGADPTAPEPVTTSDGAADALRVAYRGAVLRLAARDLTAAVDVSDVAAELADLAAATLEAALAVTRGGLPADAEPCRLAVIAMGKCGGQELNYASDVDVIFVAEARAGGDEAAALRTANSLAVGLMRTCSAATAEGTIWPVDAALRPEGKSGPLVRTLASHVAYYERWARTWEFQALLKARPVAGDLALGRDYVDALAPLVWRAAERDDFVADVQAMRRRVEDTLPADASHRQLKLGPGGLRDVEFAVQLLQLVHGRSDDTLRSPNTLAALEALSTYGYVGRDDAAELDRAYRFLRTVEHRLQVYRLQRTHLMPDDPAALRRLGRSIGMRTNPVRELEDEWRRHAREVRRLHEKLFYRPLLASVARLGPGEARLTPEAARSRLEALGYVDPTGALRHLEALTAGVSRRAAIQRTLLPVMLGWFADAPDPDGGLLAFRRISEAMGTTPWYLRLLRDEGAVASHLAHLLASSRYAVELLEQAPDAVRMLADDAQLRPRSRATLQPEVRAAIDRHDDPETAVAVARSVRRRELFRIAAGDVLGFSGVEEVEEGLTDVAAVTVSAALDVAIRQAEQTGPLPTRLAVVAMGRFGGHEFGYSSDADVLFVHDPVDGADEQAASEAAHAVVQELRRLLSVPSADPPLAVDADLRPEGRQGPLVRTLASYRAYYERWSLVWESQALLRAEPLAGDADLGARFMALVDPIRYPEGGLDESAVREIRRIKARVEAERLPRGADPARNTKLGPGGLADVEWTVQLLQLRHGAQVPGLRTTRTLAALAAAAEQGLVDPGQAETLSHAWRMATRVRNAGLLVRGRPGDSLPSDLRELSGIARLLGYPPGAAGTMVDDYRRATRRARTVVDEVFYR
ncbi:MAG: bifunctional [glutamine synthetase] adenylyltransferase/[glutamine synthetase]-adenylyl-L-tyrosine phosphorylase [Actinomycetes bacterium]